MPDPSARPAPEVSFAKRALLALRDFIIGIDGNEAARGWQNGPRSRLRGKPATVGEYIQWLRALETGPLGRRESSAALVQRLRRLCYSIWTAHLFVDSSGNKSNTPWVFDVVTQRVTDYARPPLTTDDLGQDALDGLFGTSVIVTGTGVRVSASHLWAAIDLILNGVSLEALLAKGVPFLLQGTVVSNASWLGDLAIPAKAYALFVEDTDDPTPAGRRSLMQLLINDKCAKRDLLGDLDGIAVGRHWARHPGFGIASFLEAYYASDVGTPHPEQLGRPSAAHRFHHFLNEAEPQLPIGGRGSDPLIVTFDKQAARDAMRAHLARATDDAMITGRLELLTTAPLDFVFRQGPVMQPIEEQLGALGALDQFHWLCDEFCRFLDEGVRTGDGAWPDGP